MPKQICVMCGRDTAFGSGRFVNRIDVLDDYEDRKKIYKYPEGEHCCAECDEKDMRRRKCEVEPSCL